METISAFGMIILIPIISILFYNCCLKYYSTKDPRLSEIDKKNIKEKAKSFEFIFYRYNILFSLCITFLLYYHFGIWGLFPIFIIGFSIIFRAIKKIKISNILCGVIVAPAMVIIVFNTFYTVLIGDYEPIFLSSNNNSNCQMVELEVSSFNSKFLQYEGDNATGTQVKALVNQVIASNASESNAERKIEFTGLISGSDTSFNTQDIVSSKRYKIHITEYYSGGTPYDGCVKTIDVNQ